MSDYQGQISEIQKENIVYVDETGIDTYLYREYGRAQRGKKVYGKVSGRKFKRVGIVAGKCGKSIISPLQYSGTMDSRLFEYWFEHMLMRDVPKGTVIVMDNASFHRKKKLFQLAQSYNCRVIFLPPYSPDLNPIENFWSWLKSQLRKILPLYLSFDEALSACF